MYRTSRPVDRPISAATSAKVSSPGPVTSWICPAWRSSVSTATNTSARSSASMKGSAVSPAGKGISPASTPSRIGPSLKFCAKKLARTTVRPTPDSRSASSAATASGSPRPESSTTRRTPLSAASRPKARIASGAPGAARSGFAIACHGVR